MSIMFRNGRFSLIEEERGRGSQSLAAEVERGLRSAPKSLPCRFFYDAEGSALFEEICELPEYYLSRAEDEILAARAGEIAGAAGADGPLVELGSGSAKKTRHLIRALLERRRELLYLPIDISPSALASSAQALLAEHPGLSVRAIAAEYDAGLGRLETEAPGRKLVLWLGSNVGNLAREEAAKFLRRLVRGWSEGERLLLGVDLRKDAGVLERAYDDARGVTARFNRNLLRRINAELAGEFDPAAFRHVARYDAAEGRVDMHLESIRPQVVRIAALDMSVDLAQGERIHTESSYKYSPAEIHALARAAGMEIERAWSDGAELFREVLLRRAR